MAVPLDLTFSRAPSSGRVLLSAILVALFVSASVTAKLDMSDLVIDLSRYTSAPPNNRDVPTIPASPVPSSPAPGAPKGVSSTTTITPAVWKQPAAATKSPQQLSPVQPASSPAISTSPPPASAMPEWLRPQGRPLASLSVVVPAFNASLSVLRTLQSVESSIHHFRSAHPRAAEIAIQVIIVDDASTDNTAAKVAAFIEKRKRQGITNPTWKLLASQHNLGPGASRNIGVASSSGEVIFFCDSDDLYMQNHIFTCFDRLDKAPNSPSVTLGVKVDAENITREWIDAIAQTLTMSTCLLRTFFDFIEGLPEGHHWNIHEDVAFLQMRRFAANLLGVRLVTDLTKDTTHYMRYPGNSLDRQIEIFNRPYSEAPTEQEQRDNEPFMRIKELIANSHGNYLRHKKHPAVSVGKTWPDWDRFWSMYQYAIRQQMKNEEGYPDALLTAPFKTWRVSLLQSLGDTLARRGNATAAGLLRDLIQTLEPSVPSEEETVQLLEVISTAPTLRA